MALNDMYVMKTSDREPERKSSKSSSGRLGYSGWDVSQLNKSRVKQIQFYGVLLVTDMTTTLTYPSTRVGVQVKL